MLGQTSITFDTQDEYYYRILQVAGISDDDASYHLRPYEYDQSVDVPHPLQSWYATDARIDQSAWGTDLLFHEPVLFQSYNTTVPRGANDGAVWQGRGYNTALSAGIRGKAGPLHVKFQPVVGMAQNLRYDLAPYPAFNNQVYNYRLIKIDYVQRYGPDSHQWADLGDSYVELQAFGLRSGISNEKVWTGPAVYNPLLFGYNAPGFLHFHLSSNGPIETVIGNFEFSYLYGALEVSDYFEGVEGRTGIRSNLTSVKNLLFSYSPSFASGLSLGVSRVFQESWPTSFSQISSEVFKIFEPFIKSKLATEDNPSGYSVDNQMATVFGRWVFPDAGLDTYFEFGRNDHNYDLRDFRALPNHHRAYVLGFIKTFHLSRNRILAVNYEMTQHEPPRSANILGGIGLDWHAHAGQIQGFTQKGQLIATEFGPGNNVQSLAVHLFGDNRIVGARLARIERHNGRMIEKFSFVQQANSKEVEPHEVRNTEFLLGLQLSTVIGSGIEISVALDQSYIMNQHYLYKNDLFNTRFGVTLRKNITGWAR